MEIAVRAPNHLGDGVMAIPAIRALTGTGKVTVYAPSWGSDLYRDLQVVVKPRGTMRGEVAVLLAPSMRAAWQARRCRRRVGTPTDYRSLLLTDRVPALPGTADTYRAVVAVLGAKADGPPVWASRPEDRGPEVPDGHVGLNPISAAGAVREWRGYQRLAGLVAGPVVVYGGPGEAHRVRERVQGSPLQIGLPLPAFAKALERCRVFVSNDSGAAHFAAACGVPTVVVFGSTTASRTGPQGCQPVQGPELACRPCYGRQCPHNLECLDISVESVLAAVEAVSDA